MMRSISATPSRWSLLMWALVAIGCGSEPSLAPRSTGLTFSDPALDTAIRFAIQKPTGAITPGDIAGLQWLSVPRRGVVDLSGLQNLTSLRSLDPSGCSGGVSACPSFFARGTPSPGSLTSHCP